MNFFTPKNPQFAPIHERDSEPRLKNSVPNPDTDKKTIPKRDGRERKRFSFRCKRVSAWQRKRLRIFLFPGRSV